MLLRALIVILLALNLGVAAWWWVSGDATHAPPRLPADTTPRLRLVSEGALAAAAPAAAPGPGALPASASAVARCVRLGPFADAAARDAAWRSLGAVVERAVPRDVPARSGRGWRVIVPPLPTREAATAEAERMRAAGIRDLYVLNEGVDAHAIALGRYGNEQTARRREADLRGRGFAAQAEPLGGGPAQPWLDARLRAGVDPAALAARGGLRGIDCATVE